MRFNLERFGLAAGAVAFSLTMAACHGQSPGNAGYAPTSSSALSAPQAGLGLGSPDSKRKIVSSCGDHVHIVLAAIIDCKFRERGYGSGTFTLDNHTKGIVIISPSSGTKATTFTILGAVLGQRKFRG